MRAYVLIICEIQSQNSPKMDFVQHDHVVQAFATDGTDDSLSVGILPGRSWRRRNFANLHAFHAVLEIVAKDAVAISKKKSRRFFVRESVDDLQRSPFGIGIRRDVEVNDLSPIVPEYHENLEHSKGRRQHGNEVARSNVGKVVSEERPPSLGRWLTLANHVLGHRPFGDFVPQEKQL